MQMCETTDRNRIVKAEGVEARQAHDSEAHRFDAYGKCGVCALTVRVLTWGDLRRERCDWMTTLPGLVHTGLPRTERHSVLPVVNEETGSKRQPGAQRVMRKRMA